MNIQEVDMSEYDEADRNYNETFEKMYRMMVHIKPHVIYAIKSCDDTKKMVEITSAYANLCMTFGEFKAMTVTHMPNLEYKRMFYKSAVERFGSLLSEYRKLTGDDLVLTEAERKIKLS